MRVRDRVAAWVLTGPLGHLWSVVVDLALLFARYGWRRLAHDRGRAGDAGQDG
jgi:hypothetical protein